ncbi:MAG: hypothetical protein ACTSPI_14680, partial [Candidatus Heimdallarchaeaceae archaeon]
LDYERILEFTSDLLCAEYYFYRVFAYYNLQKYNKIQSLKIQFQMKFERALNHPRNALILALIDLVQSFIDEEDLLIKFEEVEQYINQNQAELIDKYYTILFYFIYCQYLLDKESLEKAEEIARIILNYALENKDPYLQSRALNYLSHVQIKRGEFRKARRIINSAILPIEKTGSLRDRERVLRNLLLLDLARMDYRKALERCNQRKKLAVLQGLEELENNTLIMKLKILNNTYDELETELKEQIQSIEEHELEYFYPYLVLAWLKIIEYKYEEAESLIAEFENKVEGQGVTDLVLRGKYFRGLIKLKQDDHIHAAEIFNEISEQAKEYWLIEVEVQSLMQYINALVLSTKDTPNSEKLQETYPKLERLITISEEQFIPKLTSDTLILQSIVNFLDQKYEPAKGFLAHSKNRVLRFKYRERMGNIKELERIYDANRSDKDDSNIESANDKLIEIFSNIIIPYEGFTFVKQVKKS